MKQRPLCYCRQRAHSMHAGILLLAAFSLLLASCMSPTDPDTPRKRITEPSRYFLRTLNLSNVNYFETGYDIKAVRSGGFIITGSAFMEHNNSLDVFLLRTDEEGNQLWVKTFGGIKDDYGYSVIETSEGGFMFVGSTLSFTNGGSDIWLVKTDENGNALWSKNHGLDGQDEGYDIIESSAGGYILVGYSDDPLTGGRHLYVWRIDEIGNPIWEQQPVGSGQDNGAAIIETRDGGYVSAGKTISVETGVPAIWLRKVNATGDSLLWNRHISTDKAMEAVDLVQSPDGSFAVVGNSSPRNSKAKEMLFVKTDASGDLQVERVLHLDALAQSIQLCPDGGYIVCGYTDPYGGAGSDIILVRLDANGNQTWKKTIGGMHMDRAHSVATTADGGFILTGTTQSYGSGTPDLLLIKTDPTGSYEE